MDTRDFETVNLSKRVLSRLGVFFIDMKTGEGFADSRWSELGHSFDELKAEELLARVHPHDREHVRAVLDRHMRGEIPAFRAEIRLRDTNGTYRWFISSGIVERRDEIGAPLTYVGHHEDVTSLHALREELQEARQVAEDRAAEAEALRGAGAVVVASLDAPTAVRSVIQQLHTLVAFDSAVVCELENRQLRYVGGSSDVTKQTWKAFA